MACRIVFDLNDKQGGHHKSQRINGEGGIDTPCPGNDSTQSSTQAQHDRPGGGTKCVGRSQFRARDNIGQYGRPGGKEESAEWQLGGR